MRECLAKRDRRLGEDKELPLSPASDFKAKRLSNRALNSKGKALATALEKVIQAANTRLKQKPDINEGIFSTHSLRRGGASAMAEAGVEPTTIKAHGR